MFLLSKTDQALPHLFFKPLPYPAMSTSVLTTLVLETHPKNLNSYDCVLSIIIPTSSNYVLRLLLVAPDTLEQPIVHLSQQVAVGCSAFIFFA